VRPQLKPRECATKVGETGKDQTVGLFRENAAACLSTAGTARPPVIRIAVSVRQRERYGGCYSKQ
jgi:hypothetical protein